MRASRGPSERQAMTTATDAAALAIANLVAATDAVVAASHDLIIEAAQLPEVTAAIESQTARLAKLLPAGLAHLEGSAVSLVAAE